MPFGRTEEELEPFVQSIKDRFGPVPEVVKDLFETVRLRWMAESLGFEKLALKGGVMKCYFLPSSKEKYYKSDTFGKIIRFVQTQPKKTKMKEYKNRLILHISGVDSISKAKKWLEDMKKG